MTAPSRRTLATLVLALGLSMGLFVLEGDLGVSLWDEGHLWYGVQRVLDGGVPLRDFRSYDPGRYYLAAGLMRLAGTDSLRGLRIVEALAGALGLFLALRLLDRDGGAPHDPIPLVPLVVLCLWMFPRHKLFDVTTSIALVAALSALLAEPTGRRAAAAGVVTGLAAVMGRNHGLYALVAALGAWLVLGRPRRVLLCGALGILVGYAPVLGMAALVPGFASAAFGSWEALSRGTARILPLPVPWPWTAATPGGVLTGLGFLGVLAVAVIGPLTLLAARLGGRGLPSAPLQAAVLAAPGYAFQAFSRADLPHLAQGIAPALLTLLLWLRAAPPRTARVLGLLLVAASLVVVLPGRPARLLLTPADLEVLPLDGRDYLVDAATSADVALIRRLAATHAPDGETFVVTPVWPGAHALTRRASPLWNLFAVGAASEAEQRREIARLDASPPAFVLVVDLALDGREDRRFRATHPLLAAHVAAAFRPVPLEPPDPRLRLFLPRKERP